MKKICKYLILIIFCFIIELLWFKSLKIYGIIPNIFLCILVRIFEREELKLGHICAFLGGFIESSVISTYAPLISYLLIIPVAKITKKYIQNDLLFYIGNVLIASIIYELSMWITTFSKNINFTYNLFHIVMQIIYNLIIALLIFVFCEIFNLNKKPITL